MQQRLFCVNPGFRVMGGGGVSACTNRFRISLKTAGYDMQGPEGEGGEFLDPITQPKNFLGIPFPSPFLDQIPVTVKLKENPRASDSSL
jgi:hypothetical protein